MRTVFVLDTSYLCELYRVPDRHRPELSEQIKERIRQHETSQFYVPLACLYELCDHIGDVVDGGRRREIALKVVAHVETSAADKGPWLIVPVVDVKAKLPQLLRDFSADPLLLQMGLTDSTIVSEAHRLKQKYSVSLDYRVHIWTTDTTLKAHEPDPEPDALL
ncbi:hypothetical protein [Candidatus Palauibacter sp.]|uniref:hypothetical protein n=1 Tax=Candidatus Palauibacter sp. TaxID=3101350 RepID=UPI003B5AE1B9